MGMNMGINQSGARWEKIFLRKYRWLLTIDGSGNTPSYDGGLSAFENIVYVAARPNFTFVEQELVHAEETIYYPARAQWEPIEVVFWNVSGDSYVYEWMKKAYNPEDGTWGFWENIVRNVVIKLLNGIGDTEEEWILHECWPSNINWGDLDYTSNEVAEIRTTLRYSRAEAKETHSGGGAGSENSPSA